jgi:hypothetical protein
MTTDEFFKISMTAEEFQWVKKKYRDDVAKELMIEFAKYHVKKALEAAAINYRINELNMSDCPDYLEKGILSAYPLENIK